MREMKTGLAHVGRTVGRRTLVVAGASALAALAPPRGAAFAQGAPIKLRYAHTAPTTHVWQLWGVEFKKEVEARSGGRIQVTIYPNAEMGDDPAITAAVRLGVLEMGAVGTAMMKWVPQASITDAPFLFKTRTQCYAALDGALGDELRRLAAAQGFRLIGFHDLGFRCMTNSRHPVLSAADLKGLKMRVPDSKSYIAMMQAMGSSVVATGLNELYLALSQKLADGQDTPPSVVKALNLNEVQKYVSRTDHVLTSAYAIMNPAVFARMSPEQQDIVTTAAGNATGAVRTFTQKDEDSSYAYLAGKGMQVIEKVDGESFRAACQNVIPSFPELFPPALVKLAQSASA